MPRGDKTGPMGMGPMTGRRGGYCAGFSMPGYANPYAWGGGRAAWGGRGYRHWFYASGLPGWARFGAIPGQAWAPAAGYPPVAQQQEIDLLRNQARSLKEQLEAVEKRIGELEGAGQSQ